MPGLTPRKYKDHRRYSFAHTFGTTSILSEIDLDTGLTNFNQNIPNPVTGDPALPEACTAFARTDIATNEDKIIYKPGYTYAKSCVLAGVPEGAPLPLETSFKSGIVDGLQAVGETTDAQALTHARGPYFEVHEANGQDIFDSLWSALQIGQRGISVGTPWFPELTNSSLIDSIFLRTANNWHDWEAVGVKNMNGVPHMKVKAWTGDIKYFSRQVVNALYSVKGSDALTDVHGKATLADIQTVRLTKMQLLVSLIQRLISWTTKLQSNTIFMTPGVTELYPDWSTPQRAYHNTRVIADAMGMTAEEKNRLCECIYQESGFHIDAVGKPNSNGTIDYGLCQFNNGTIRGVPLWIGEGAAFKDVDEVLTNPEKCVRVMIKTVQAGHWNWWSSFSTGAYKQWASADSPMWKLATVQN